MDSDATATQKASLPLTDDQRAQILNRYRDLVDQKYLNGLSEREQEEMDALGDTIDGFHDEFYAPILADLRERLKSRKPVR